jgi:hypothetical protein
VHYTCNIEDEEMTDKISNTDKLIRAIYHKEYLERAEFWEEIGAVLKVKCTGIYHLSPQTELTFLEFLRNAVSDSIEDAKDRETTRAQSDSKLFWEFVARLLGVERFIREELKASRSEESDALKAGLIWLDLLRKGIRRRNNEERRLRRWLATRKNAANSIDSKTAEVGFGYDDSGSPYGIIPEFPEELLCVGRNYFARSSGSKIWISFDDLPNKVRDALWEELRNTLMFPANNPLLTDKVWGKRNRGLIPRDAYAFEHLY